MFKKMVDDVMRREKRSEADKVRGEEGKMRGEDERVRR